jgi:hypothetical protein
MLSACRHLVDSIAVFSASAILAPARAGGFAPFLNQRTRWFFQPHDF